jgi:hypothetical protein
MTKKVAIGTKPRVGQRAASPDKWVATGATETNREVVTRFTIDIPTELHTRIKAECALKRVKMREAILALLEAHFPAS